MGNRGGKLTPPGVGEYWEGQGGFFVGLYSMDGDTYALIVADTSADLSLQWKTSFSGTTPGTDSFINGAANTAAIITDSKVNHPAAAHCADYRGGGYADWFLPAKNQLEIAYRKLKPGTDNNDENSGENPNAIPPTGKYFFFHSPSQTTVAAFKRSEEQAFEETKYFSSTRDASFGKAITQDFKNGAQDSSFISTSCQVRPFRSVKLN